MELSLIVNPIVLIIEICVAIVGGVIAVRNRKRYGWFIALTFICYVIYDMARFVNFGISSALLSVIFLVASVSILIAVILLVKEA